MLGIITLDMKNYSSLENLSVVHHNQMLIQRMNADTEAARIAALDALLVENDAFFNWKVKESMMTRKAFLNAQNESLAALRLFFNEAQRDNTFVPTFWIKE